MSLFDALGFRWDRSAVPTAVPCHSIERVCFRVRKELPEFVWDAAVLEGNPFTFTEVMTLLDGVTVGGHTLFDRAQVLSLVLATKRLLVLIKGGQFALTMSIFSGLNSVIALREALEMGVFCGEAEETDSSPDPSLGERRGFDEGVAALQACEPFERALAFFLFGALQRFFLDGNAATSRFMMNGVLLAHGIDAISVPAARAQAFKEKMARFYLTQDGTEMMAFLSGINQL